MPDCCDKCGQSFEPEPGFYTGAMYVNYGFAVTLTAICYLILEIILHVKEIIFWTSYSIILICLWPFLFRYSRVLYLYLFIRYDESAVIDYKNKSSENQSN